MTGPSVPKLIKPYKGLSLTLFALVQSVDSRKFFASKRGAPTIAILGHSQKAKVSPTQRLTVYNQLSAEAKSHP